MSTYDLMASELREQRELAVATIQRQNELYESVSQQLQDARGELHEAGKIIASLQEGLEKEWAENQRKDAEIERHVQKQPCGHPRACVRQVEPWGGDFVQVCAWCESLEQARARVESFQTGYTQASHERDEEREKWIAAELKIKRYREALEGIGGFARTLCETQHQMHPAHIRLVAMITDAARAALKGPAND